MSWVRRFAAFWYDFIVGDDWRLALGVVVGLGVSAIITHAAHPGLWWLLPMIILATLIGSLRHGTRDRS